MSSTMTPPTPNAPGLPTGYNPNTGTVAPNSSAPPTIPAGLDGEVLMLSPDGQEAAYVPQGQVSDYTAKGGQVGVRMTAPNGDKAIVPFSQQNDYQQKGAKWDAHQDNINVKKYLASQTPAFSLKSAVAGPTTALGAPTPQPIQNELTGVADMAHGNFRKGAARIWDAEKNFVIQGGPLEKAIQKIDPTFQGSATASGASTDPARPTAEPIVDAAQFIDKDKHPIAKAVVETAQSLVTPENAAVLYSTGGLGLIKSPEALGMASRLISAGFSANAIATAYKHLEGFTKSFDEGDLANAEYQLTHALTSGAIGILAARGAAAKEPVTTYRPPNPWAAARTAIRATPGAVADAASAVKQVVSPTTEIAGETLATRPMRTGANTTAATQAVRNIADDTSGAAGGLPTSHASSLRDVFEEPIAAKQAIAQTYYAALDKASNNQWTANQNALKNIRKEIQMKGGLNDDVDAALNAKKIQYEWQQDQIIDQAVKDGMPADVAQKARAAWYDKSRLEDLQDVFNKKSNVSGPRPEMRTPGVKLPPEHYNFKGIAKDLNAMDPDDLTKALGSREAAQKLVTTVNLAAQQGWGSSKAMAAVKLALQLVGAGHVGVVAHLLP